MRKDRFEYTAELRARDCDVSAIWRPDAIFLAMQEISGAHTRVLECDHEGALPPSILWVLYRMRLNIHRDVRIGESVTLRTYHTQTMRMFFPRHYGFYAQDGSLVASASSLWLLMDRNTRRMTDCEPIRQILTETVGRDPALERPDSVAMLPEVKHIQERLPQYSDLDLNGHVNNARYVTWLCDLLGIDCLRTHRIESLLVNYRAEVRPGVPVTLRLAQADREFSMEGLHDGQQCFCCGGTLVPRA
ncbi:MAG TPA: thioesterase [Clostridia bacterium]|nr:thioesterase [Clostridia bacterium]